VLHFPSQTGTNQILVSYTNDIPHETFTWGVIFLAQYNFTFGNNMFLGVQTGYQTDNLDHQIFHKIGFAVGKRL
jgi:hypothetical protein